MCSEQTELSTKKRSIIRQSSMKFDQIVVTPYIDEKMFLYFEQVIDTIRSIARETNNHFGKIVIFTIFAGFVCVTAQAYYLINIIRKFDMIRNAPVNIAVSISMICMHVFEFSIIFMMSSRVKDEVRYQ